MKIKPKQYAVALFEAVKDAPKERVHEILDNFINTLVKNNALRFAPQIIAYFIKYTNQTLEIGDLKISSAEPLKDEVIEKIGKAAPDILGKKFKKLNIIKEVDPSLIGGFILESEDRIFDNSLKNKFKILKNYLSVK